MSKARFNLALARDYLAAPHQPEHPIVQRSYDLFRGYIEAQYAALLATGLDVDFQEDNPYSCSADLFADIERGVLLIYGLGEPPRNHPMNGTPNLHFRAVHDWLGHYGCDPEAEHYGFGRSGEELAFLRHRDTLPSGAWLALCCETRAQTACNLWLHDVRRGPNPPAYAPQKAVLLPSMYYEGSDALV